MSKTEKKGLSGLWGRQNTFGKVSLIVSGSAGLLIVILLLSIAGISGGLFDPTGDGTYTIKVYGAGTTTELNVTYDIVNELTEEYLLQNRTLGTSESTSLDVWILINETGYYPVADKVTEGENIIYLFEIPDSANLTSQIIGIENIIGAYNSTDLIGMDEDTLDITLRVDNDQEDSVFGKGAYLPNCSISNTSQVYDLQGYSKLNYLFLGLNASFSGVSIDGQAETIFTDVVINGIEYNVTAIRPVFDKVDFEIIFSDFDTTANSELSMIIFDGNLDVQYNLIEIEV